MNDLPTDPENAGGYKLEERSQEPEFMPKFAICREPYPRLVPFRFDNNCHALRLIFSTHLSVITFFLRLHTQQSLHIPPKTGNLVSIPCLKYAKYRSQLENRRADKGRPPRALVCYLEVVRITKWEESGETVDNPYNTSYGERLVVDPHNKQ
jgi:hypothetical protein